MKNPFRTRYRARRHWGDRLHYVYRRKWWWRKWQLVAIYNSKSDAERVMRMLSGQSLIERRKININEKDKVYERQS